MKSKMAKPLILMLLSACSSGETQHHEEAEEAGHGHDGEIVMCPTEQKACGVVTERLQPGTFAEVLHTSGRIAASASGQVQLTATVGGTVSGLCLNAGRSVNAGSLLLNINATAQERQSAQIELQAARTEMERLERLLPDKLANAAEAEAARTRLRQAELAAQYSSMSVRIPADGILQSVAVTNGQTVQAGDMLATVTTRNTTLLLEAVVPTHYADKHYGSATYKVGRQTGKADTPIGITTQVGSDGCTHATFGGLSVTAPIGSYCEVWLKGTGRDAVLSVPLSALTESQGTHYIYIKEDKECFRRQAVTPGANDGERVELTSGAKPGDVVVTQGTYAVRAAGQTAAIPGHSHSH